ELHPHVVVLLGMTLVRGPVLTGHRRVHRLAHTIASGGGDVHAEAASLVGQLLVEGERGAHRGHHLMLASSASSTHTSTRTVTGPSLVRVTAMSVRKRPVATVAPSPRKRSTTRSTRGSACSG